MQRKAVSFFKLGDKQYLLNPWTSTNRGTCGDGEFSNPNELKNKDGFYGRGKWNTVDVHRIDTYDSIYIPTTHMPEVAAKFSFYGWVHHMLEPAIYVSVTRVHPYLPPLFDKVLEDKISKEGELAGIHHIPWHDVALSRKVFCPFSSPIPVYLGEPVINTAFECRNYSIEILSADSAEAVQIYQRMKNSNSDFFHANERPVTLEEAIETNLGLKEAADSYVIDKESPFYKGSYTTPEGLSKNQIIDSRCKEYSNLMDANNVEKKITHFLIFSNSNKIKQKLDEIRNESAIGKNQRS